MVTQLLRTKFRRMASRNGLASVARTHPKVRCHGEHLEAPQVKPAAYVYSLLVGLPNAVISSNRCQALVKRLLRMQPHADWCQPHGVHLEAPQVEPAAHVYIATRASTWLAMLLRTGPEGRGAHLACDAAAQRPRRPLGLRCLPQKLFLIHKVVCHKVWGVKLYLNQIPKTLKEPKRNEL